MIQQLTEFTVSLDYGRAHTTFLLHVPGQAEPVARMHKEAAYDHAQLYEVRTGPGLDRLAGYVSTFFALAPDRSRIGEVNHESRSWRHDLFTFAQAGLAPLTGEPVGLANKARRTLPVLDWGVVDAALRFEMRYRSAESAGFEFAREAGVRASYTVTVHDPRIDRVLLLACLVHFNSYGTTDLRKGIVDVTANPFKA
ncbi:hypothetical protein [Kitasatospora sp. MMS16-BH015]|uniref:hypothetical protein n=1 Tax=Kitasatospora sp. MMS16-BH015 TaxID=2018025 RepID=UPI00131A5C6A|nr:hypothetical protein [Kitasatospora sp. MMS16-BH015]